MLDQFGEVFSEEFAPQKRHCELVCKKACVGWNVCPKVEAYKKRLEEAVRD